MENHKATFVPGESIFFIPWAHKHGTVIKISERVEHHLASHLVITNPTGDHCQAVLYWGIGGTRQGPFPIGCPPWSAQAWEIPVDGAITLEYSTGFMTTFKELGVVHRDDRYTA